MKTRYIRIMLLYLIFSIMLITFTGCPQETLKEGISIGLNEVGVFFIFERRDISINDIIIYTNSNGVSDIMFAKTFHSVEDKTKIERVLIENQGDQWKSGRDFQYGVTNPYKILTSYKDWQGTVTLLHKDGKDGETVDFADTANMKVILTIEDAGHKVVNTKEAVGSNYYK